VALVLTVACARDLRELAGSLPEATVSPSVAVAALLSPLPAPTPSPTPDPAGVAGSVSFSGSGGASPTPTPVPTPTPYNTAVQVQPIALTLCRPSVADSTCPATGSISLLSAGATVSADSWSIAAPDGSVPKGAAIDGTGIVSVTDAVNPGLFFIEAVKGAQAVSAALYVK